MGWKASVALGEADDPIPKLWDSPKSQVPFRELSLPIPTLPESLSLRRDIQPSFIPDGCNSYCCPLHFHFSPLPCAHSVGLPAVEDGWCLRRYRGTGSSVPTVLKAYALWR